MSRTPEVYSDNSVLDALMLTPSPITLIEMAQEWGDVNREMYRWHIGLIHNILTIENGMLRMRIYNENKNQMSFYNNKINHNMVHVKYVIKKNHWNN